MCATDGEATVVIARPVGNAESMDDEARFGKLWREWDSRVDRGEAPRAILKDAKDEDLVEILGGESDTDRKYARDIIATELLNRLHSRNKEHPSAAKAAEASARRAHQAAKEGQAAIHHAEELLKASGQVDFGDSVSNSAYKTLDASKAAFDDVEKHAHSLERTLAQSRSGGELARETAEAAQAGSDLTHTLERQMKRIGKAEEGKAAAKAGEKIQATAEKAAEDADASHEELESREER